jgi:hypothetical protein
MKRIWTILALCLLLAPTMAAAQDDSTLSIVRVGTDRGAYHYVEVVEQHKRWIAFDTGYIDFNQAKQYRELYLGTGRQFVATKNLSVIGITFFDQANGAVAGRASSLIPWVLVDYSIAKRLASEANYFVYVPLNTAARKQSVLEHAKVEYTVAKHLRGGVGYAGQSFGNDAWQNKPFATVTIANLGHSIGDVEMWAQRLPGHGSSFQVRWNRLVTH